jgi:hypothetical protein
MLSGSLLATAWIHPQVVDGGKGLQICQVAANILNKQSWTADNELTVSLSRRSLLHGVGWLVSLLKKTTVVSCPEILCGNGSEKNTQLLLRLHVCRM